MVWRKSRFFEGNHGNASVPDGRDTWLHANRLFIFDFKAREFLDFAECEGIVRTMPKRHQCEYRVHHRGVDGGKALSALDMIQHPRLRFADGALAERFPRKLLVQLEPAVYSQKYIFPGKELVAPIQSGGLTLRVFEELVHMSVFRKPPVGAQRGQNRHGNDNPARPGRHFVNIENEPVRDEHQLRRNRRNQIPAHCADQRKVKTDVGVGMLKAAEAMNHFPRAHQIRRVR